MKAMKMKAVSLGVLLALGTGLATPPPAAATGIPVVDVAAIAQMIEQYGQMVQQLEQLKAQLDQAKQAYAAITGGRGMENLLRNENRNVIPSSWQETLAQMQGGGAISGLAKSIKENAGLEASRVANLDDATRKLFDQATNSSASWQANAGQAYDNASQRFSRLQGLMDAIGTASDAKAIADLTARIGVEQVMLQNEAIKMQGLAQAKQAIQQQQIAQQLANENSGTDMPPLSF